MKQGVMLYDIRDHWARESIQKLVSAGIINGYGDATFKPDNIISRAEMVAKIAR